MSADYGDSWAPLGDHFDGAYVPSLAVAVDGTVYAVGNGGGFAADGTVYPGVFDAVFRFEP